LRTQPELRHILWTIVDALKIGFRSRGFEIGQTTTPVIPVAMLGDEAMAAHLVIDLRETYGIFCSMIIFPVIPRGMIILRIIPTAVHSLEDVEQTLDAFTAIQQKLSEGAYSKDLAALTVASEDF